jgi:hypothetical protein
MTVQKFPPVAIASAAPAPAKPADLYGGQWGNAASAQASGATRPRLGTPPRAPDRPAP